ncbi:MAG: type II toxin-antitoxin system VapC family toxin [Cyanobacteria bacterium J06634_5]
MADIYVDSCLIISLIEGKPSERELLSKRLDEHCIYSSELARLETRVLAIRKRNQASLQKFEQFFAVCQMVELNRAVFDRATAIRARSNLKTPDALYLAVAIQSGCEEFWTEDKRLVAVAGQPLKVMDWAALEDLKTSTDSSSRE